MGNSLRNCNSILTPASGRYFEQRVDPCINEGVETVRRLVYKPKRQTVNQLPEVLMSCQDDHELTEMIKSGIDPPLQLCVLCAYAARNKHKVRAVESGSRSSRLAETSDILLDMSALNKILTQPPVNRADNMDKEFVDIEVEGGMLLSDFIVELDAKYGLGLPMVGDCDVNTVAEAAMTGVHGSGFFAGIIATSVVSIHLITCRGIQVRLELGDETFEQCEEKIKEGRPCGIPVLLKSTHILQGVLMSLGSLGIIYSITYRCVPVYNLEERRKLVRLPWNGKEEFRVKDRFLKTFSNPERGEFFSFFINPYPEPNKFLYATIIQSKRTTRTPKCCSCCACWCGHGGRGCSDCDILQNSCSVWCLMTCTKACPTRVPDMTNFGLSFCDREEYPFIHTYYNVLQISHMHVRKAEWCLPLDKLDAALGDVIDVMIQHAVRHRQFSLLPVYVRISKTDHLLLSPANRNFPTGIEKHCCYIEVPILSNKIASKDYVSCIDDILFEKYKARPNWPARLRLLNHSRVQQLYPGFPEWQKIFKLFNKDGTFCNEFTQQLELDDSLKDNPHDGGQISKIITVQPLPE